MALTCRTNKEKLFLPKSGTEAILQTDKKSQAGSVSASETTGLNKIRELVQK